MLMEKRQTKREFTRELSMEQLGEFLWLACRSRSSRESPYGPNQESRPHPSAGALHPIHALVARDGEALYRYAPSEHALVEIPGAAPNAAHAMAAARAALELDRGWVLALVAEPGKTGSKYENPETLVWRDAGVVLGYMSVVAEALGMAFCPLGVAGGQVAALGFAEPGAMHGVGLAVLGLAHS
jgi:SagB-type dehydrogenase family enzyme